MRDGHFTFLIVPEDESKVRKIRLSYRTLRWLGALTGALGLALLVGLGTFGSMVGRTGRLALLERENRRLQAERAKVGRIVENLERSERTYQQIRSLAGLEELPSAAAAVPVMVEASLQLADPQPPAEHDPLPPEERPAPEPAESAALPVRGLSAVDESAVRPSPEPAREGPDALPAEELRLPAGPSTEAPETDRPSPEERLAPSGWPLAVEGFVTARFEGSDGHTGIDIAVPRETPVLATAPGRVREAGLDPVLGHYVVVAHDGGTETLYAHNARLLVEPGQRVARREAIAFSGNSGRSTAPHLHYEVRRGGRVVDPDPYLH